MQRPLDTGAFPGDFIQSPRNPRVRDVARLYKRRERDRRGVFVAEGLWALRTALDARADIVDVYYCDEYFRGGEHEFLARANAAGARLTRVGLRALQRLSFRDGPDGIVCVVRKRVRHLHHVPPPTLVCVVEAIEKPGNLGAIIRTACAADADAVVVCDPLADVWAPAVVRASLGAVFLVPVIVASTPDAVAWLQANGVTICAATPSGRHDPWSVDLAHPSAIVIGNEHRGLGEEWLDAADVRVRIPMSSAMNSLNASTAAGIVLFEAVRQRAATLRSRAGRSGRPRRASRGSRVE